MSEPRRHVVHATAEHRAALRAAGLRAWWRRPGTWARLGCSVVLIALGLALYDVPVPLVLLLATVVPAALLGLAWLRFARGMDRRLAASWGDGTEHVTVFDDDGLTSRGPLGGVELRLPVLRSVHRHGGVVEVRLRPRGSALVVEDLFPVDEEQRLVRAMARAPEGT
jgi:hypothetical protein